MSKRHQCSICNGEYRSEKTIPQILRCGHTFCLACVSGFVSKIQKCFTCFKPLEAPPSKFPTNRAVLSAESVFDTVRYENGRLRILIQEEKQNISKRLERMTQLSESLTNYEHLYDRLDYSGTPNSFGFRRGLQSSLENIHMMRYSCLKPKITPDILLSKFSSKENFFRHIMVELYRKKSIYACKSEWNQTEIYWGELNYIARQLCIHSFTEERPPSSSLIVAYGDLVKCMNVLNFRTFIDVAADRIVCQILSSSEISWKFVKSCTGEEGVSFKGSMAKIELFNRHGHKFTDVNLLDKHPVTYGYENYKFLASLPWIPYEAFSDKLHVSISGGFCRIRKYHTLPNKESSWDVVPFASATSFGHIFSSDETSKKHLDDYMAVKAPVKDCGILVSPFVSK